MGYAYNYPGLLSKISGSPYSSIVADGELKHVALLIFAGVPSIASLTSARRKEARSAGLIEWQRRRVVGYIEQNLGNQIDNTTLSQIVRRSVGHFQRSFKLTFGQSPQSYIMERRLEKTFTQIQSTTEPLSDIADSCGFSDQSHLCKIFRAKFGTPPSSWRRGKIS